MGYNHNYTVYSIHDLLTISLQPPQLQPLHAQDPPTFPLAAVATGTTQQQEPEYSRVYQKIEPRKVPTKIVTQGVTVEYEEPGGGANQGPGVYTPLNISTMKHDSTYSTSFIGSTSGVAESSTDKIITQGGTAEYEEPAGGANQGYTPLNIRTTKHNSTYSKSFIESTSGVAEGVGEPSTDKIVTQGFTVEYEEPGGGANQGPGVYAPLNVRTMKHDNTYSTFLTQSTGKDWLGASGVAEPSPGKIVTQGGTVEYEEPGGTNQGPGIYTPLNVSTMKQQGSMYSTSLTQSTSKDWLGASGVVKPSMRKKVQSGGDFYAGIETETLNKPSEYAQHK